MTHSKLALNNFLSFFTFFIFLIFGCDSKKDLKQSVNGEGKQSSSSEDKQQVSKPNILLIIVDDIGLDALSAYSFPNEKPNTPNIDNLAKNGIAFSNFWSAPTCSPTRASLLTGKYGFRTGVLKPGNFLDRSEVSLHRLLSQNNSSYQSIVIGKWHLSGHTKNELSHPNDMGVPDFRGYLTGEINYTNWQLVENGKNTTQEKTYSTTKFTEIAIDWIKQKEQQPWFLWLAYNAAHTPLHLPPTELHTKGNLSSDENDIAANPRPYFFAMIEAIDYNIGKLINSLSEETKKNTVIIFMGDNGTSRNVISTYRKPKSKGTVYEGGVNVPLIVSGAGVDQQNIKDGSLIHVVDLFSTILDLTETENITEQQKQDSQSFKSILRQQGEHRDFLINQNETAKTIRNKNYKFIKNDDNSQEFYDLINDPYENNNLIDNLNNDQTKIKNTLAQKMQEVFSSK